MPDEKPLSNGQIAEHRHLGRVPVVDVVRRELVMPAQPARVGFERDERRGVEIVAFARVAVVVGSRISRAEEDEVLLRIVGAGDPNRAAAAFDEVRMLLAAGRPCSPLPS